MTTLLMLKSMIVFGFFTFPVNIEGKGLIVPHLPKDTVNFSVSLIVENLSDQARRLEFLAYDVDGNELRLFKFDAPAETRMSLAPDTFFDGLPVSYFQVHGGFQSESGTRDSLVGVIVGVSYRFAANPDSTAFVGAVQQTSRRWRVHTGDWKETFDGLAITNADFCQGTGVQLNHRASDGALLKTVDIQPTRGRFSKAIVTLNSVLDRVPGSYVDISANTNLAVVALRGSLALGFEDSFLVGNLATPLANHETERRRFEENREKWAKAGVTSYVYTGNYLCFCVGDIGRDVAIVVREGWIQSYRYVDDETEVAPENRTRYMTVDDLFLFIEKNVGRQYQRFGRDLRRRVGLSNRDLPRRFAVHRR